MSVIKITIKTDKLNCNYGDIRDLRSLLQAIDHDLLTAHTDQYGMQAGLHSYFYPNENVRKYHNLDGELCCLVENK